MTLAPAASASLSRFRQLLVALHGEAVAAEAAVTAHAEADPIGRALDQLVGIGPILALTIRAEVGDIARFARGPELASYAGLVPRVDRSADRIYHGRITREGSPWLRWALIEAAMHARRRDDAVGRWYRQLALRRGILKARVAFARRLCDDVVTAWRSA